MGKSCAAMVETACFPLFFKVAEETYVLKVDIEAHQPGTDVVVPETSEDDQQSLVLGVGGAQSELVLNRLAPPGVNVGTMELTVTDGVTGTPSSAVQLLKSDGVTLLSDFSVDLSSPQGDLAGLASDPNGVTLMVAGMADATDITIKLAYMSVTGVEVTKDEVHLSVTSMCVAPSHSGLFAVMAAGECAPITLGMTAYRPTTEGLAYGNPFQKTAVPENQKETPGVGIRVNGDDDNGNSVPDRSDTTVSNENDLIEVVLNASPLIPPSGFKYVLKRSSSSIKVWNSRTKGTALLDTNNETNLTFRGRATISPWYRSIICLI